MQMTIEFIYSSVFGRETAFGFYVDSLCGGSVAVPYFIILIIVASFLAGIYLFINGMVNDLKYNLKQLDQTKSDLMWSTYANEIRFHNEIIE